jgi:hypothetical protein
MPTHAMGQLYREGWDEQLLVSPKPLHLPLPVLFTQTKNRHFDRSCSRPCEQRSGEIRFLPMVFPQPTHSPAFTIPAIYFSHFPPKNRMSSPKTT